MLRSTRPLWRPAQQPGRKGRPKGCKGRRRAAVAAGRCPGNAARPRLRELDPGCANSTGSRTTACAAARSRDARADSRATADARPGGPRRATRGRDSARAARRRAGGECRAQGGRRPAALRSTLRSSRDPRGTRGTGRDPRRGRPTGRRETDRTREETRRTRRAPRRVSAGRHPTAAVRLPRRVRAGLGNTRTNLHAGLACPLSVLFFFTGVLFTL